MVEGGFLSGPRTIFRYFCKARMVILAAEKWKIGLLIGRFWTWKIGFGTKKWLRVVILAVEIGVSRAGFGTIMVFLALFMW